MRILSLLLLCLLIACNSPSEPNREAVEQTIETDANSPAEVFWQQLRDRCGLAFEGRVTSEPVPADFLNQRLVMHIRSCDDERILIPFHVGENRSRTWVLTKRDGRIELKHDHRHQDGSPDEITLYGGTTTNSGLPDLQVFPADSETAELIPAAATNIWWMAVQDSLFTYNLRRANSSQQFTASFRLTDTIPTPPLPWGWE